MVAVVDMDFSMVCTIWGDHLHMARREVFLDLRNCAGTASPWTFFSQVFLQSTSPIVFFPHVLTDTTVVTAKRYSMIFALKAYIGERSFRDQFKARHAINDCKARPRAAAEARWIGVDGDSTTVFLCHQKFGDWTWLKSIVKYTALPCILRDENPWEMPLTIQQGRQRCAGCTGWKMVGSMLPMFWMDTLKIFEGGGQIWTSLKTIEIYWRCFAVERHEQRCIG